MLVEDEALLLENVQPVIDTAPTPSKNTAPPSAPLPEMVVVLFDIVQFVILSAPPYHPIAAPPNPYVDVLFVNVQFVNAMESNGVVSAVPPRIAPPPYASLASCPWVSVKFVTVTYVPPVAL